MLGAQISVELTFRNWEMCQTVLASQRLAFVFLHAASEQIKFTGPDDLWDMWACGTEIWFVGDIRCLDIGVSLVCPRVQAGQRQPARNEPHTPSF